MTQLISCENTLSKDNLLGGRITFFQPAEGYRVAIDPVLLAAAVTAESGETVLDAGSGTGAAALCLALRISGITIRGIEVQTELVEISRLNAEANSFSSRLDFVAGDLSSPPPDFRPDSFDHVISNPPFMEPGKCRLPDNPSKRTANVEGTANLAVWLEFCVRMVKPGGSVTIIHRADRMQDLLAALDGRLGRVTIFPLWPSDSGSAKRIIIRGFKGDDGPMRLAHGLVLHGPDGSYTNDAEAVLRHGKSLEL